MKIKRLVLGLFLFILAFLGYRFSTHQEVLLFLFPEKIWAHRVNSLEKLEEVKPKFRGIELDIVWEEKHFDVNHPPAKSIDLSLADYFKNIQKQEELGIWLDLKNLDINNFQLSYSHLDSLARMHDLKKDLIIVESPKPHLLNDFLENGYNTSYYLPGGLNSLKGIKRENMVNEINNGISGNRNLMISSSLGDYKFMKEYFPIQPKLLWHLGELHSFKNKKRMYFALFDEKVEVVLLPFDSKTGNR